MNTDTITAVAEIVIAVVVLINCGLSIRNGYRAKKMATQVGKIEFQTNGINQKLIDATAKGEFARGVKKGEENNEVKPRRAKRKPTKKTTKK